MRLESVIFRALEFLLSQLTFSRKNSQFRVMQIQQIRSFQLVYITGSTRMGVYGVFISLALLALLNSLGGCTTAAPIIPAKTQLSVLSQSDILCENAVAKISIKHPTARLSACKVVSSQKLSFINRPENTPINDSAWYGFRVDPVKAGTLRVLMRYKGGKHRYPPKVSYDGTHWEAVPASHVVRSNGDQLEMRLELDDRPFFVSAQEILTKTFHDTWTDDVAGMPFVTKSVIGSSRDGHPISMLTVQTYPDVKKPYVVWVGRQHPPEVTGALALIPFTETVLGESPLAKEFREKFNVLIIPNMNPDGVTAGHWRHNKGGVDINRDWGPFTQPETQAVKSALSRFETGEDRIAFFLDFHSTWRNLFYTQTDDELTSPPMFARDWLTAVDVKLSDKVYKFTREPRKKSNRPTSKNYMYDQFGISAITYEVGDNTDRKAIKLSAKIFAEEMMRLLLEHEAKP